MMKIILSLILMTGLFGCHHSTQPEVTADIEQTQIEYIKNFQVTPETLMVDFAHRH